MKTLLKLFVAVYIGISLVFMGLDVAMASTYDEDLYSLAHVIMGEAEGGSWKLKKYVGSVVLNRMNDSRFPDTITDVIFDEGQYSCTWDGRFDLEPNTDSWMAAQWLLRNGSCIDSDVVWQAEFIQGEYIYDEFEGMYFCG